MPQLVVVLGEKDTISWDYGSQRNYVQRILAGTRDGDGQTLFKNESVVDLRGYRWREFGRFSVPNGAVWWYAGRLMLFGTYNGRQPIGAASARPRAEEGQMAETNDERPRRQTPAREAAEIRARRQKEARRREAAAHQQARQRKGELEGTRPHRRSPEAGAAQAGQTQRISRSDLERRQAVAEGKGNTRQMPVQRQASGQRVATDGQGRRGQGERGQGRQGTPVSGSRRPDGRSAAQGQRRQGDGQRQQRGVPAERGARGAEGARRQGARPQGSRSQRPTPRPRRSGIPVWIFAAVAAVIVLVLTIFSVSRCQARQAEEEAAAAAAAQAAADEEAAAEAAAQAANVADGVYYIEAVAVKTQMMTMDVAGYDSDGNNVLMIDDEQDTSNQQMSVTASSDGKTYTFVSANGLAVDAGESPAAGQLVYANLPSGAESQSWVIVANGDETYSIRTPDGSLALQVEDTYSGAAIVLATPDDSSDAQKFRFVSQDTVLLTLNQSADDEDSSDESYSDDSYSDDSGESSDSTSEATGLTGESL